jgi:uncharacterized caspase-like protein
MSVALTIGEVAHSGAVPVRIKSVAVAVVIGIGDYTIAGIQNLRYAENDARALAKSLEATGFQVKLLINAGRREIIAELVRAARELTESDRFVLYFAGHALRNSWNDRTYLLTRDTQLDLLDVEGIRLDHFLEYLAEIKGTKKLLLLDHSYSGDVIRDVETTRRIPASPPSASSEFVVVAAARDHAFESPELEHGLFTDALLRALETREAAGTDGLLSTGELVSFVTDQVRRKSAEIGVRQEVVAMVDSGQPDWIVAQLDTTQPGVIARKNAYFLRLRDWQTRGWISFETEIVARDALDAWVKSDQSGKQLDPRREKIVRSVRDHLDFLQFDATVAASLQDELEVLKPMKETR